MSVVSNALKKIGKHFDIYGDYKNDNFDFIVSVSNGTFGESVSKQISDPEQIAKLMPKIGSAIKNAIGIEMHDNRYYYDDHTTSFLNLIGGYVDGDYFVPIRFGVKISVNGEKSIYVVIDQEKIRKDEVVKSKATEKSVQPVLSRSSCVISIAQVLRNVNSKDLLRYIPRKSLVLY